MNVVYFKMLSEYSHLYEILFALLCLCVCVCVCTDDGSNLAQGYMDNHNLPRAVEILEGLIAKGSDNAWGWASLADAYCKQDKLNKAEELLEKAIQQGIRSNTVMFTVMMKAAMERGDMAKVIPSSTS